MFASRLVPPDGEPVRLPQTVRMFDALVAELRAVPRRGRPSMDQAEATMVAFHFWTALHGMVTLRLLRPLVDWPDAEQEIDDLADRLLR